MKLSLEERLWFKCFNPRPDAALRLFCFPYAGAGASAFRIWAQNAPTGLEVQGVQLPGRESRLREPLFTSVDTLVDALVPAMVDLLDKPFSIFGHSLGALIGFELTRRLQELSLPLPQRLFVSARQAPQIPLDGEKLHLLPEAHLKEELRHYAGTPEIVLQDTNMMSLLLPTIRADMAMNETYSYVPGSPVSCPISAFAGLRDAKVSVASVEAWAVQTSLDFEISCFDGNHFFVKQEYPFILNAVMKDLD
jgi:medium-chain acyl-[acyl-carrier-protein] hydrolase